jgi:hypothetical protein
MDEFQNIILINNVYEFYVVSFFDLRDVYLYLTFYLHLQSSKILCTCVGDAGWNTYRACTSQMHFNASVTAVVAEDTVFFADSSNQVKVELKL